MNKSRKNMDTNIVILKNQEVYHGTVIRKRIILIR